MERRILREATRLSDLHVPFVLALIVMEEGSTPRKSGSSMLLTPQGAFVGTVGGARLEEEVKVLMQEALRTKKGGLHHFDLRAWKKGGLSSLCGGSVDVAVQYVSSGPNILIWGAGHTGRALGQVLSLLDYDHSVADDRKEYLTPDAFPRAKHRWCAPPDEVAALLLSTGENFSHLYVLGYEAKRDEELLAALLPTFRGHLGLIASKTKRGLIFRSLAKRGLPNELLRNIRSPVGLPIGGETPQEIAISIAAEIISDLYGGAK